MLFKETPLSGSYLIDLEFIKDDRGFFSRLYCNKDFNELNINYDWRQVNNSLSLKKGTLRGPHIQCQPNPEAKLVRCINGKIWDVIIDLRLKSETFGSWFGFELSSKSRQMIFIPEGFAHGMLALEDNSEVIYFSSSYYSQKDEICISWNDAKISISWPIDPIYMSSKEESGLDFDEVKKRLKRNEI